MLPAVLSDDLCSLHAGQVRFALFMDIYLTDDGIGKIEYGNAFIKLRRNFCYEEPDLLIDPDYTKLLWLCRWLTPKYKYVDSIDDSHDVVSYLMILMNYYCAKELLDAKTGIFRSSYVTRDVAVPECVPADVGKFIKIFNSSRSQYVSCSSDTSHHMLNLEAYIHMTSPIRRLVDLLNMIEFQRIKGLAVLSDEAYTFYSSWIDKLDYINLTTKTIRRVQNDCDLLHLCTNNTDVMEREYDGYLFNKTVSDEGSFQYSVFLPELKMTSRIIIADGELEFSSRRFKLFLFKNEENFKRKIRIHPLHL
jgi:exoribonuclease R